MDGFSKKNGYQFSVKTDSTVRNGISEQVLPKPLSSYRFTTLGSIKFRNYPHLWGLLCF